MIDLIIILIILIIVGSASLYIYKAKKRGQKCIGCPYAQKCAQQKDAQYICNSNLNKLKIDN